RDERDVKGLTRLVGARQDVLFRKRRQVLALEARRTAQERGADLGVGGRDREVDRLSDEVCGQHSADASNAYDDDPRLHSFGRESVPGGLFSKGLLSARG